MVDDPAGLKAAPEVEILPPERSDCRCEGALSCLCCGRTNSFIDEDGCGICEECLSPQAGFIGDAAYDFAASQFGTNVSAFAVTLPSTTAGPRPSDDDLRFSPKRS